MKEELLNGLRELQSQLGESVTEEQVKLLDEHYNIKRNLEKEISDLLTRISNDKNYTRTRELPTSTDVLEREIANSDIRLSEAQEARIVHKNKAESKLIFFIFLLFVI